MNVQHRTLNVERRIMMSLRSSNYSKIEWKTNIQYQTFNSYFFFFSAVLILATKNLINYSVSSKISSNSSGFLNNGTFWISFNLNHHSLFNIGFFIHHWMLDVRCSTFIFFNKPSTVHPAQKNNLALMDLKLDYWHLWTDNYF